MAAMRVSLEPAYLLHRRPFRDSSQLLEVFTAHQGCLAVVGKGLTRRRRGGPLGAQLQAFRPLLLSYSGRGELPTLTGVEVAGELGVLKGEALFSGFYLNELVLRVLHRHDAQPEVFSAYAVALGQLAALTATDANLGDDRQRLERVLRNFEFSLLEAIGYGVGLGAEGDTGELVTPERHYLLVPQQGLKRVSRSSAESYRGQELLAVAAGRYEHAPEASKRLVRQLLQPLLGDRPLKARSMFARQYGPPGERMGAAASPAGSVGS